jgi:L-ascorbate metabolism protein UlaG (beta-lactamase superfamily)
MRIVRLLWAGVQIEFDGAAIAIDPQEDSGLLCPMLGDPSLPPVFARQSLDAMLVTHSHPDD